MTCKEVQEQLSAWLDGEIAGAAAAALAAHLEECPVCRGEWQRLAALEAALAQLAAPVPPGLAEKVLSRLQPRPHRHWWQSLALAASLVLGLVLGGSLARNFYSLPGDTGLATAEVATLDDFHDFPQGSLGTILASYQPDEANGNGM